MQSAALFYVIWGRFVRYFRYVLSSWMLGLTAGGSVTATGTVLRNIHFSGVGVCLSGIDCLVGYGERWILSCMFAACWS